MTDDFARQRRLLDAQIERWTADAKKLADTGNDAAALELYCRAADELPGAPWLQHRTAELARKLKKQDTAINYFRRAATAFQIADFSKRAVAPLRMAWSLAMDGLPGTSKLLVELAVELMQLYRRLGFAADATVTFERTNTALRTRGFSEMKPYVMGAGGSSPPASEITSRGSATPPGDDAPSSRSRAIARLFERR